MTKKITITLLLALLAITPAYAKQGDEKVFAGWILHMFISGQLKEYTPRGGMSECLKVKRKIMRSQGRSHGVRWECKKGKLNTNMVRLWVFCSVSPSYWLLPYWRGLVAVILKPCWDDYHSA